MNKYEYQVLFEVEDRHWWYKTLHELIIETINNINLNKPLILDAGCGTGGLLKRLDEYNAVGLDIKKLGISYCKQRNLFKLVNNSVMDLSFKNNIFDIVLSLDVIYHKMVEDDNKCFEEMYRILKPGGYLIMHLPAYDFLRGPHDANVHSKHRYLLSEIKESLLANNFIIKKLSYRNCYLFPLVLLRRTIQKYFKIIGKSEMLCPNKFVNFLFYFITSVENKFLKIFNFPFGLNIFAVARKPE